ncbi:MAG: hypothetical protein P8176_05930 [Gammaproteobacteria bacterium]
MSVVLCRVVCQGLAHVSARRQPHGYVMITALVLLITLMGLATYSFKESVLALQLAQTQQGFDDLEAAADAAMACQLHGVRETGVVVIVTPNLGFDQKVSRQRLPPLVSGCVRKLTPVLHTEFGATKAVSLTHRCGQAAADLLEGSDLQRFQAQRYVTTGMGYRDETQAPQAVYQQAWVRVVRRDESVLPELAMRLPRACSVGVKIE